MSDIILRRIDKTESQYMAIYKTRLFNGMFFMVFQDNIFGMISLNHFMEMIRDRYKPDQLNLLLDDENIEIKDKRLFNFIMNHFKKQGHVKEQ
ncbi:MAG: hypothetical protein PVG39_31015 [Desulfobacteraceae bacterium]|jgi:hypothetical protein